MLENLHRTKELGLTSRDLLLRGDLDAYGELMHEHWMNKRDRSPGIHTERVDTLYTLARRAGAIGGKLVGAGGGGFLLVYTPRPSDVRQAMAAAHAQELPFDFEFRGAGGSEYT
jgi:D-glycero-alpha-D-manno-heptose-7-phosphate kinase